MVGLHWQSKRNQATGRLLEAARAKPAKTFQAAVLAAMLLLLIALAEIVLIKNEHLRLITTDYTFPLVNSLATVVLGMAAFFSFRRSRRLGLAWSAFTLAQLSYTLGDVSWTILEAVIGISPYPSIADAFYLGYYPLVIGGILLLPRKSTSRREQIKKLLDLGIIVIASIIIFWNFLIGPLLLRSALDEPLALTLLSMAYPTSDMVMVWALLVLIYDLDNDQPQIPLLLLGFSGLSMVITDIRFSAQTLNNTYISGGFLDIGWILAYLFSGLAGVAQLLAVLTNFGTLRRTRVAEIIARHATVLPYLWIAGAYMLLIESHQSSVVIDFSMVSAGVGIIIALVLFRQVITLAENQRLFKQLNSAMEQVQVQARELEITNQNLLVEIAERKRVEVQLAYDALHDGLTGLPNRALFTDRLSHAMNYARRNPDYRFSVLFLDLDSFKVINDSLGHSIGDQLLFALSERLRQSVRASDTVARLGGDEFVILLENETNDNGGVEAAVRIQEVLNVPFQINGHEVTTTVSVGLVSDTRGYNTPEEILRDADIAMYRAKSSGKAQYAAFNPELRTLAMHRLQLENELRHAIDRQEFCLQYQPIYTLEPQKLIGFEALIRWQHPTRGMLPPAEFIRVAEETGLILPIGKWVLFEACAQLSRWRRQHPDYSHLIMCVNISGRQFSQGNFVEQVEQALQASGLQPDLLKLEITESVVIDNHALASDIFSRLAKAGVRMQVDDFGTGYSSLSYLQHYPIQGIKIDKSFIQEMGTSSRNADLVRTVLMMARDLGMTAVAEGIETQEQLEMLKSNDCVFGQGYLLGRPMDETTAEKVFSLPEVIGN